MSLNLYAAAPSDAARIAEIHMAAFGSNMMLRAQFPTPAIRKELQRSIEWKALADMQDSHTTVLVVRYFENASVCAVTELCRTQSEKGTTGKGDQRRRDDGYVIGFATWSHPVPKGEYYLEPAWIWPDGTNLDVLGRWAKVVEDAQSRALGDRPHYRLNFIATDPIFERRGAASMMVGWGVDQCRKNRTPAYLESTLGAAVFYENRGFKAVARLSLTMIEKGLPEGDVATSYEEIGFIFEQTAQMYGK